MTVGLVLFLCGILVVLVPQILVALVAGVVITAGIYAVSLGLEKRSALERGHVDVPRGGSRFDHVFRGQERGRWSW